MEQPVSLPSYMYIPAPIQQQIVAYETGDLLEVYKWGWIRDKRATKLLVISLLITLSITIISAIVVRYMLADDSYMPPRVVGAIGAIPALCACFALVFLIAILKGSICVCAYSNGLLYAKNMHVIWLPWSECAHLKPKVKRVFFPFDGSQDTKRCGFTLKTHDGRSFRFGGPLSAVEELGKIMGKNIAH